MLHGLEIVIRIFLRPITSSGLGRQCYLRHLVLSPQNQVPRQGVWRTSHVEIWRRPETEKHFCVAKSIEKDLLTEEKAIREAIGKQEGQSLFPTQQHRNAIFTRVERHQQSNGYLVVAKRRLRQPVAHVPVAAYRPPLAESKKAHSPIGDGQGNAGGRPLWFR